MRLSGMNSNDTEKINNLLMIMECLPKLTEQELSITANFLKLTVENKKATIHYLQLVRE
jgi:uncharacterized membrane protein YvbJ